MLFPFPHRIILSFDSRFPIPDTCNPESAMRFSPCIFAVGASFCFASSLHAQAFLGTEPLEGKEDLAAKMVEGIDKYLDRELRAAPARRKKLWNFDFSSPDAYVKSVNPNRERLKKIIGVV